MQFLLKRLAFYLVAFLVAATFNFAIPRMLPGNPADIMLANANAAMGPGAREALMATFGFIDAPLRRIDSAGKQCVQGLRGVCFRSPLHRLARRDSYLRYDRDGRRTQWPLPSHQAPHSALQAPCLARDTCE